MTQNFGYMNDAYLDKELQMSPEELAYQARVKALMDKTLTTKGNFFQAPDFGQGRFQSAPLAAGLSVMPSSKEVQDKVPTDYSQLFRDGKVMGMQVPEFTDLMGRLANSIAPDSIGGRMGAQLSDLGQKQIINRREDMKPENVIANMKLDALKKMTSPQVPDPSGQVMLNPQTPASQTRLSLMQPNSFIDGSGQPRSISTPATLDLDSVSTMINHNTSPMLNSQQPMNIFQAEGVAAGQSLSPQQQMLNDLQIQQGGITNQYLPKLNDARIAYENSATNQNNLQTEYIPKTFQETVRGNIAKEKLEARSISERERANQINEAQRQTNEIDKLRYQSSQLSLGYTKQIEDVNLRAQNELKDPRNKRHQVLPKAAAKGIIVSSGAIRDALKHGDKASLLTGQSHLLQQIEQGIQGVNAVPAGDNAEKLKTEGIYNILGGLESIRDIDPDYYNQIVSELPGRINITQEQSYLPLWGKTGKPTTLWDASKAIEQYERSKGRGTK